MKKILCIGHVSYDITIACNGFPVENRKYRINDKVECGGGPASNAAYLLGKWGMDTAFIGVVGNDHHGRRIKAEFDKVHVHTEYMELDDNIDTSLSFIIVNRENGSRTTFSYRNPNLLLKKNIINQADIILLDGRELSAANAALDLNPNAISILDAGSLKDEYIELGKRVSYLVTSKVFAEDFANVKIDLNNPQTVVDIYRKLEETFKNTIVITMEDKGCLYKKDGFIKLMPSIKVNAVDSTGAGDFFHGAFAYGIANGFDIEKTLKISNIAGALSVTRMGSRNSVYPLEEVMRIYEENK